jgi:hypothetical protein
MKQVGTVNGRADCRRLPTTEDLVRSRDTHVRFIGGQKGKEETLGLLSAFAKLRKATVSFVMSVCPSVQMELGPHLMDFREI